jgi:hypothetical protein
MMARGKEKEQPKKVGRPQLPISQKSVEELAAIGCTNEEIATVLGCHVNTLTNRFCDSIKKGRENMKVSLRRQQLASSSSGNVTMQIWLGKQYLGQRDKSEVDVRDFRQRAEAAVTEYMRLKPGASRNDAILALSEVFPNISELVH